MAGAIAKQYRAFVAHASICPARRKARSTRLGKAVGDRCDFLGGDLFVEVPAGADAYLISGVLHNWGDGQCLKILCNCRHRVPDEGRLLVVDTVLSDKKNVPDKYRNGLDLGMLIQTEGGMERTDSEFRELLAAAGFRLSRVIPMNDAPQSVIEAVPTS